MINSVYLLNRVKRKFKFGIFIPKKITLKPKSSKAVISDLFPIRNDVDWKTEFELLNIPGLINGNNKSNESHLVTFYFFDAFGDLLGNKRVTMNPVGRQTIKLDEILKSELSNAKTFSVFHNYENNNLYSEGSFLAERGYTGYEYKNNGIKGYVHGNLDAVALSNNKIEAIGNMGFIPRTYTVQHKLIGPARYEFIFTNPTTKTVKIRPYLSSNGNKWVSQEFFKIKSLGRGSFTVDLDKVISFKIKFKSKLYLGRPVVFRLLSESMDVFHG